MLRKLIELKRSRNAMATALRGSTRGMQPLCTLDRCSNSTCSQISLVGQRYCELLTANGDIITLKDVLKNSVSLIGLDKKVIITRDI